MTAKLVLAALCLVTLAVAVAGLNSQAKSAPSFLETRLRRATAEPRCGKEFGNKKCSDLGKSGQCCSKFGYCGSKAFHCVTRFGCQSECDDKKDPGSEESSLAEPASVSVKSSSSQTEAEVNKRVRVKEVMNAVPLCKKCMHGSSNEANGGDAVPVPLMKVASQQSAVVSAGSQPDVLPATQRSVSGAGSVNAPLLGSVSAAAQAAAPMASLSFSSGIAPSPVPAPSSANLVSMIPQVSGSFSSSSSPVISGSSSGFSSSATDPLLQSDIDMIKEITADATKKALQIVAEAEKAAVRVRETDCNGSSHGCKRRIAVMVSDSKPSQAVGLVPSDNDRFEMHERVMKLYGHE